jgi:hypothetical protein
MQSLGSQLQSLQAQIAGLQGGGGGTIAPSHAYNHVQVPQFKHAVAPPVSVTTAFGGMSEIQAMRPAPLSTIDESGNASGGTGKKSYMWVAVLVIFLILVGTGVAVYFVRRAAKKKQEAEDMHLKALAAELEERQLEERRLEEAKQEQAMLQAMQQQQQAAIEAARNAERQRQANAEMAAEVSRSLLSRAQPAPPANPRFVPFVEEVPATPKSTTSAATAAATTIPAATTAAATTAAATIPAAAATIPAAAGTTAPATTASAAIPVLTQEARVQAGNEYLDRAIASVTSSIKSGLQQAILTQKTFSPEPQRDASLLHNQGELGLRVSGAEQFPLRRDILEDAAPVHPTGEVPVTGTPPALPPPESTLEEL